MWLQFFLEDGHFVVNLLLSLALFGICWLYFDAWSVNKTNSQLIRVIGFFFLAISFFIHSTHIEFSLSSISVIGQKLLLFLPVFRGLGYLFIIISLITEPLMARPKRKEALLFIGWFSLNVMIVHPLLAVVVFFLYLRRSTVGLEDHLKPLTLGFLLISFAELFSLASLFRQTTNVDLFNLVSPFGPLWIIENLFLSVAAYVFIRWVFGYLLKRFQSQMFIILTSTIVLIFFIITILYTSLLFKNFTDQTLSQLETNAKIFQLAIESKKNETANISQLIAGNESIKKSILEEDNNLSKIVEDYLIAKKQTTTVVVSVSGQVLARGENSEKKGDSLSDNLLIKDALDGRESSSIVAKEDVVAPKIYIMSSSPIKDNEKIIGAVMTGVVLDNAFIDGVKKTTGLEASIYAYNQLSSSTIVSPDGRSRLIGIKEENSTIQKTVLEKGENYQGELVITGISYLTAFLPLRDKQNNIIGMLFVGKTLGESFGTISYSLELTFIIIAVLLLFSIIPSYYISKYIEYQLK
jgi:hypothetical protein